MIDTENRISIQVGLSGYSFKIQADGSSHSSGWLSAERIFSTQELQKRYGDVEISVFTPKFTLVPAGFHTPENSRRLLGEVTALSEEDVVDYVELPHLAAVMVYSLSVGGSLPKVLAETVLRTDGTKAKPVPEACAMLNQLQEINDYNKILASYMDGYLYLVVAQGKSLLLCNSFKAPDFTTAQYFIFLALKKLQLNPEMSTLFFRTPLEEEQEFSLYRYFRNVERLDR